MTTSNKDFLFKRISKGDKKAFDVFFEQYYPKLIQFARIFVYSREQAEDIVSDVLTNMLLQRQKVFVLENFDGYLFTAIKNKALSYLKKKKNIPLEPEEHQQFSSLSFIDPHDILVEKEFRNIILSFIESLPPKRKIVFQLVRENGMSYSQVADLLDISERTVEVHLRIAVKAFRKRVEEYLTYDIMNLLQN